jgi:polyisoprenoid-binding protein YceI
MKKMKKTHLVIALMLIVSAGFSQKKTTTSATVAFDATTALDALPKAENKTVVAALDTKAGSVQFEATVKGFAFGNPKIQEHFNSAGWMNSDEFPKATFSGTITNLADIKFKKTGTYTANVEGDLTIHGKTQKVNTTATIVVAGKKINTTTTFSVKLADYAVDGPAVGAGKVSAEPKITVKADFK